MRYIIYGAGGIGGGMGALLARAGEEVLLIARGEHLRAIQRDGLQVRTPSESWTAELGAFGHPDEIDFQPDDAVILAMKSQDTRGALDALDASAHQDMPIVCAQNGVSNEREAARRFRDVYAMVVIVPATMLRAGEVGLHGQPVSGRLDAGCFPSGVDPFIEGLTSALARSGFVSEAVETPMRLKYGKLLSNLANGVHAICSEREAAGDFIERLRAEGVACFNAARIDYTPPEELAIGRSGWDWGEIPGLQRTGGSTHQSFTRHLPTIETDYLNGEVVLLGKMHGVPTPANRAIQLITNRSLHAGLGPGSVALAAIEALEQELGAG